MGKERREKRAIENAASGVDNTHRKTWNKDDYEEQAEKREEKVTRLRSTQTFSQKLPVHACLLH
jgi:hypothetical protein